MEWPQDLTNVWIQNIKLISWFARNSQLFIVKEIDDL